MNFLKELDPGQQFAFIYTVISLRYLIIAGFAFLLFYQLKPKKWLSRKIQHRFPDNRSYYIEIAYSMLTFLIFALIGMLIIYLKRNGYTLIYDQPDELGWPWFVISIVLMLLLHDTWFYWTHRLMHHPKVFPIVHRVHHFSHNPSPWASFSFHPIEALIEAMILPIIAFTIPSHGLAIIIFLLIMTLYNVLGHLGFEIFPKKALSHPVIKWSNTSTHHNMHHRFYTCNFGLYFNFWDRIMGTNHRRYEEYFDKVVNKNAAGSTTRRSTLHHNLQAEE